MLDSVAVLLRSCVRFIGVMLFLVLYNNNNSDVIINLAGLHLESGWINPSSSICILLSPTLLPSFKLCSNPSCPTPHCHAPWTLRMQMRNAATTSTLQERQACESPLTPHMLPFHGSADVQTPCTTHEHKCHTNTCPCLHT